MSIPIDTGIPADSRENIAEGLSKVLADSYTLYLKTHNFHRPGDVPMEVVRLEIQRVAVGQDLRQALGDLLAAVGRDTGVDRNAH